jgi:2-oxoglutarate ferredoxin oxidoreductase subunit alpha
MTEAPLVIVNVMRAAPSTGQPTSVGQGDLMQARYGSHGDVEIIAVAPYSSQEMYDLTIRAFNLAEKYRVPVVVLSDEKIAHLKERVVMHNPEIINRKKTNQPPEFFLPYKPDADLIPPMANFGDGYKVFATGLTHDEKGYPDMKPPAHISLIKRINDKIRDNVDDIVDYEEFMLEDADIAIVSFGISARCAKEAIEAARKQGIKVGMLRLKTIWPFADKVIQDLGSRIKKILTIELNYGQITKEITRATKGIDCEIHSLAQPQSEPYHIQQILDKINEIKDMPIATAKTAKRGIFNRH